MSQKSSNELKSYFAPNAIPTAENFADLIDSFLNKSDDNIAVSALKNIGFGDDNPGTNFSVKALAGALTGTVSADKNTKVFSGDAATLFTNQLQQGDVVTVDGLDFTVASIQSDQQFTSQEGITNAIKNKQAYKKLDIFSVLDESGNPLLYITKEGKIGILTKDPKAELEINGTTKSTIFEGAFHGNGEQLTNLQAGSIEGVLAIDQIPLIPADHLAGDAAFTGGLTVQGDSVFDGKLTAGTFIGDGSQLTNIQTDQKSIKVIALKLILEGEQPLIMSWECNSDTKFVTLQYTKDNQLISYESSKNQIKLNQEDFFVEDLYQDTVFYFICQSAGGAIIDQQQLYITVIQNVNQYATQLKGQGFDAGYTTNLCGNRFSLSQLNDTNVNTLANAIQQASYTAKGAFSSIPQYYRSTGAIWNPTTNGKKLITIFYDSIQVPVDINVVFLQGYDDRLSKLDDIYACLQGVYASLNYLTSITDIAGAIHNIWGDAWSKGQFTDALAFFKNKNGNAAFTSDQINIQVEKYYEVDCLMLRGNSAVQSYVACGSGAGLHFDVDAPYTLMIWVKYMSTTAGNLMGRLVGSPWNGGSAVGGYQLDGFLQSYRFANPYQCNSSQKTLKVNTRYFLATTFYGDTSKVFMDGTEVGSKVYTQPLTNAPANAEFLIGCAYRGNTSTLDSSLNANVAKAAVFNVALSAQQINEIMENGLTGKEANLAAYWNFTTGSAEDLSGNGNNGTLKGNATFGMGY